MQNQTMSNSHSRVVVAFSGGVDTSWCVPWLVEKGYEVTTCTVDVGGFSEEEVAMLATRSRELGAVHHEHVYAKDRFWKEVVRFLMMGHVLRGGTYPLCVGAERSLQARLVSEYAAQTGIGTIAHGCTAAGNDQVRFEVTLRSVAPHLTMLAPVRDLAPSRAQQVEYLQTRNLPVPTFGAKYSVNAGLWGVTIGGAETTQTTESIPEEAWVWTRGAFDSLTEPVTLTIGFENGEPTSINGTTLPAPEVVDALNQLGGRLGIGRGIHLGETVLGIKGRVAFEAPAASILIAAHRELEKLTTTKKQQFVKDSVCATYGDMVHEGLFTDPVCRDIESLLISSQARVSGFVHLVLRQGSVFVSGVESPFSLHAASRAVYGEAVGEWTADDAKGFCRVYGLGTVLAGRVQANQS